VLAQDFGDFELLIVDDCSTGQHGGDRQGLFCARDSRVRVAVNAANLGWSQLESLPPTGAGRIYQIVFGDDKLLHPQALGKWPLCCATIPRPCWRFGADDIG